MEKSPESKKLKIEKATLNNEIDLKEIFSEKELENLFKEFSLDVEKKTEKLTLSPNLKNSPIKTTKSKKIQNFLYDRTKFILKILKFSSDKLILKKESLLAKCLKWLTKEVEDSILFKSDQNTIKNLEELKKENSDLHLIFSWLEEYSTIKIKRNENFENLKKNLLKSVDVDVIPLNLQKVIFENEKNLINKQSENLLNFSQINFKNIETENFNIFQFESEVLKQNTLSTISCYIFSSLGYYSLVNYEKFENFICTIASGYDRTNPYHNVIKNIFNVFLI